MLINFSAWGSISFTPKRHCTATGAALHQLEYFNCTSSYLRTTEKEIWECWPCVPQLQLHGFRADHLLLPLPWVTEYQCQGWRGKSCSEASEFVIQGFFQRDVSAIDDASPNFVTQYREKRGVLAEMYYPVLFPAEKCFQWVKSWPLISSLQRAFMQQHNGVGRM